MPLNGRKTYQNLMKTSWKDADYPKILFKLHSDLPFLTERKKIEICNKIAFKIHDNKTMLSRQEL